MTKQILEQISQYITLIICTPVNSSQFSFYKQKLLKKFELISTQKLNQSEYAELHFYKKKYDLIQSRIKCL